jgi:hypothetical protein
VAVVIEVVRDADDEFVAAFGRLLPQLSQSAKPLDHAAIEQILAHDATTVFVARVDGVIAGTLTLVNRPDRDSAGRLYGRLGFRERDSRTYRLADAES